MVRKNDIDNECETINSYIERTKDSNPTKRKQALKDMCPCHVKKEIEQIWERVFEMVNDESAVVRDQVVHTLCDGSPRGMEERVIETLQKMWNDPDKKIKRKVRRALNEYNRTGKWNIL